MAPAWLRMTPLLKEAIAEFFGTFILLAFGQGSVAQFILSRGKIGSSDQIRWGWGFGVMFGIFTAGGISGAHLNPAVTLSLCVVKKCPWKKLLPYSIAQYLGAFVASCVVYIMYYDAIDAYQGGQLTIDTAGIFATYPQRYLSVWIGLADQIFATAILVFLIHALTDPDNMAPSKGYLPLMVGLVVTAIGMTFGHNCGYAINPARDLAPRLFTLIAGWGINVISYNNYKYFWIPVAGPYIGGILGGCVYMGCIQLKMPFKTSREREDSVKEDALSKLPSFDIEEPQSELNQTLPSFPTAAHEMALT